MYRSSSKPGFVLQISVSPNSKRSLANREEVVARRRELVMVPAPVGLGCRFDDTESFELLEPL
jgi:hypothetical protein